MLRKPLFMFLAVLLGWGVFLPSQFVQPVVHAEPDWENFPEIAVTNTRDNGDNNSPLPGSLRAAIQKANQEGGSRHIVFRIPQSDPGYEAQSETWKMDLRISMRPQADKIFVDGFSQNGKRSIVFDVATTIPTSNSYIFEISGVNDCWIRGFVIIQTSFASGFLDSGGILMLFSGKGGSFRNKITDNYFGVAPDGETYFGAPSYAIRLLSGGENLVENNLICGSRESLTINSKKNLVSPNIS